MKKKKFKRCAKHRYVYENYCYWCHYDNVIKAQGIKQTAGEKPVI